VSRDAAPAAPAPALNETSCGPRVTVVIGAPSMEALHGPPGRTLASVSVDKNGVISAVFSTGGTKIIGQMALADFRNPDSLNRDGNNLYAQGSNSGPPQYGRAGVGTLAKTGLESCARCRL